MRGQFGVEARCQTPEGMGMIGLDMELQGQLTVDHFDHLAQMRVQMAIGRRGLGRLIATRHGEQADVVLTVQLLGERSADVALVGQYKQVGPICAASSSAPTSRSVRLAGANSKSRMSPTCVMSRCSLKPKIACFFEQQCPKLAPAAFQSVVACGT